MYPHATTVSVDLAYKSYGDIGVAVLHESSASIDAKFVNVALTGKPNPKELARFLVDLCDAHQATTLVLDGPQGWKDPQNGLLHSRLCEKALNTPAKTGLPGSVKPSNYLPFVAFSIETFDALNGLGWPRFTGCEPPGARVAAEVFPLSAWHALDIKHLPAKKKCTIHVVGNHFQLLCGVHSLGVTQIPSHDELQALVAGLVGGPLSRRELLSMQVSGVAPLVLDETYREGFIVNPISEAANARAHGLVPSLR